MMFNLQQILCPVAFILKNQLLLVSILQLLREVGLAENIDTAQCFSFTCSLMTCAITTPCSLLFSNCQVFLRVMLQKETLSDDK